MLKRKLTPEQNRFIEDMTTLLGAWNMPANAARLYAYLQISTQPVSLDDIARDLNMSRSHAHTAAKLLESHQNARRLPSPGSKRAYYVASDDPGAPLQIQVETLGRLAHLISSRCGEVAVGAARERLTQLATFHKALQEAMEKVVMPTRRSKVA